MTSAPAASAASGGDDLLNRRMITASVMMATTVVILDMTIATIALPHMQGGLGATQDQISWVMTTYFMMQAITMSATGWLAGRLGRKRLFIGALAGFAVFSILSGNATSLEEILIFRSLQGMFSAPIIPISQALMLDSYPRERHAQAMSIWGMGVMLAPVMGPVVGGWLTDEYSWRWVFYLSMPFSVLGILGALLFIRESPKNLDRKFDVFGFTMLALALAGTQFLLDRGESEGWFGSDLIIVTAAIAILSLYMFVVHSATTKNPFISTGMIKDRNFMIGLGFMFLLGVLVFGAAHFDELLGTFPPERRPRLVHIRERVERERQTPHASSGDDERSLAELEPEQVFVRLYQSARETPITQELLTAFRSLLVADEETPSITPDEQGDLGLGGRS